ncbi:PQQ-binding-like beta-propeller repeat protein [Nocardiopsis sp. CC223A]|uniref:PQQ-binding-like beta-propeller repeat protein n=1 Tax=Nocardiopsis sp. CC223A TaxID=3044051 RepID=UPI00278BC1FF|nr:PQQ-binding-like beta-propeller repeat protein [Nocardiopsis sp. CC223A]
MVSLAGETGEEIWSYTVPDGEAFSAGFSANGSKVWVAHGPGDEPPRSTLILDAVTGEMTGEFDAREGELPWESPWDLSAIGDGERVLEFQGPNFENRIYSVLEREDNQVRWRQERPLGCEGAPGDLSAQAGHHIYDGLVVVLVVCSPQGYETFGEPRTYAVVALDLKDGREVWRREFPDPEGVSSSSLRFSGIDDRVLFSSTRFSEAHLIEVEDGETLTFEEGWGVGLYPEGVLIASGTAGAVSGYRLWDGNETRTESVLPPTEVVEAEQAVPLAEGLVTIADPGRDGPSVEFTFWGTEASGSIEAPQEVSGASEWVREVPGAVLLGVRRDAGVRTLVAYR